MEHYSYVQPCKRRLTMEADEGGIGLVDLAAADIWPYQAMYAFPGGFLQWEEPTKVVVYTYRSNQQLEFLLQSENRIIASIKLSSDRDVVIKHLQMRKPTRLPMAEFPRAVAVLVLPTTDAVRMYLEAPQMNDSGQLHDKTVVDDYGHPMRKLWPSYQFCLMFMNRDRADTSQAIPASQAAPELMAKRKEENSRRKDAGHRLNCMMGNKKAMMTESPFAEVEATTKDAPPNQERTETPDIFMVEHVPPVTVTPMKPTPGPSNETANVSLAMTGPQIELAYRNNMPMEEWAEFLKEMVMGYEADWTAGFIPANMQPWMQSLRQHMYFVEAKLQKQKGKETEK